MDKGQEPYHETIPLSAFLCGLVHYAWLYNILRYEQPPIDASIETLPLLWSGPTGIFRSVEKKNAANLPLIFAIFNIFQKITCIGLPMIRKPHMLLHHCIISKLVLAESKTVPSLLTYSTDIIK